MDGANLNARVGITQYLRCTWRGRCRMNLRKAFAIPQAAAAGHGPYWCRHRHQRRLVSNHCVSEIDNEAKDRVPPSSAFGGASILPISWMYIIRRWAVRVCVVPRKRSAQSQLLGQTFKPHYPILYSGQMAA